MFKKLKQFLDKWIKSAVEKRVEKIRRATPRRWLYVNAYGPQQATPDFDQTFSEAMDFVRFALAASFVRVDWDNSIIFFDGRKSINPTN